MTLYRMVRPGRVLTDEEKAEIIAYAEAHPTEPGIDHKLAKRLDCSLTNVRVVLVAHVLAKGPV